MKKLFSLVIALAGLALICGFTASAAGTVDLYSSVSGSERSVSGMEFTKAKEIAEVTHTFTEEEKTGVSNGDLLLFTFVVKAEKESTPVTITVTGSSETSMTYYVPVQWTKICMPLKASGLKSLTLAPKSKILLADAKMEDRDKAGIESTNLESGQWLLEDFTYTELPETGIGVGMTKDLVKSGNFLYSIGAGKLTVTDVSDPSKPVVRGRLDGLGSNTRQICLCCSGTDVMLTSRENGAYIVDVSDPDKPRLRSTYNTIEMATGLAVSGDVAFVCNRQNGVEVVDISDLDNPVQRSIIRTGEVQSCFASGNILYCGLWDLCRVDMFDISDLSNVTLLGSAQLTGKGDGLTIFSVGGKTYLYAATGQHTTKLSTSTKLTDLRYGHGNGLDIFDVTDPKNPVWLSTSRIDGRYYFPNNDCWEAEVAVKNGKVYAYLVNTYNGVYIFDVTNPKAPVRLEHVEIVIPKTSSNYKVQTYSGRDCVFPYDQSKATRGAVAAVCVDDGYMYIAGAMTDLHVYQGGKWLYTMYEPPKAEVSLTGKSAYYDFNGDGLPGYKFVRTGTQYYAVELYDGKLYAAAGSGGIGVFTTELEQLAVIPTEGICFDLTIQGDTLYAAEGANGLVAYKISGTELTKLWSYASKRGVCRSVEVSAAGKFLALQTSSNYFEIISTETHKQLVEQKASAQMYHRNLLTFENGRYLGFWGNSTKEYWYDCGENDSNSKPKEVNVITKTKNSMASSAAEYQGQMIAFTSDGYVRYHPLTCGSEIAASTVKANAKLTGKPTIHGKTLICTDRIYGYIYIADISNVSSPKVLKTVYVPGFPDFALVTDESVYIPMGYQGLIKFDFAPFDSRTDAEKAVAKFTDVKETDWFYEYVRDLVGLKVVSGMTETAFQPNGTLTYGQALKLLVVSETGKDPGNAASGHWAANYLAAAKSAGWIAEEINLDAPISRISFCRIAAKAAGVTAQPESNPFTDCGDTSVLALVKAGVINGMTETTFQPHGVLTRAQISKIISLLIKL